MRDRHADTLFSDDGSTIDEQVAALLRGEGTRRCARVATAESCTGGLLAARLTDPPGASDYVLGGIVAYANDVKVAQAGVDPSADRAPRSGLQRGRRGAAPTAPAPHLGADVGVGITGIAGPDGGSEEKPVGLVWFSVAGPGGRAA